MNGARILAAWCTNLIGWVPKRIFNRQILNTEREPHRHQYRQHTLPGDALNTATPDRDGYLILNLGTPASPTEQDVARYLNEFLMDPYVVALPWPLRRLLVSAVILPRRPKASAEAYEKIWTERGSPLLYHTSDLVDALRGRLNEPVEVAMRYGDPGIEEGIARLREQGATRIVLAPLYPQYADSTTTTSVVRVRELAGDMEVVPLAPFYDEDAFIEPSARIIADALPAQWDHVLFSYHGLPERALKKTDPTGDHCLSENCCETASPAHATCYRHQVFETSKALAGRLGLNLDQYTVSFQSRLGRLPWLRPYTDEVLADLPGQGVQHLVVACPAFVADNLETLEEIGMQGRETFLDAGGSSFTLVPCLNADAQWVAGLADLLSRAADQTSGASAQTSS